MEGHVGWVSQMALGVCLLGDARPCQVDNRY